MKREEFFTHLDELKFIILRVLTFFLISFTIVYFFVDSIISFLIKPIISNTGLNMIYTGLSEGFSLHLSIASSLGIFLTIPFALYEIYKFCSLGMKIYEKKIAKYTIIFGVLLFIIGCIISYIFIIPSAINFFISYTNSTNVQVALQPKIIDYIDLICSIMIAFGIAFQAPLIIFFLHISNILKLEKLLKYRRYVIVFVFIISAIFTPPDIVSQIILATMILILIEISFLFCKIFDKFQANNR